MAIDFPNSPTNGQTFTSGNKTWIYNGSVWDLQNYGSQGPQGLTGSQGAQGFQGSTGSQGSQGFQGSVGSSIVVKGSVATTASLPSSGNTINDAYVVNDDGHLYVWNGSSWTDIGAFVGPQGANPPADDDQLVLAFQVFS